MLSWHLNVGSGEPRQPNEAFQPIGGKGRPALADLHVRGRMKTWPTKTKKDETSKHDWQKMFCNNPMRIF
jgi:hypothetical protein